MSCQHSWRIFGWTTAGFTDCELCGKREFMHVVFDDLLVRAQRILMPSKSKKQHNLMAAAAHNPGFAKKAGVPQSVAKEFVAADKASGKYRGKKKSK